MDWKKLLESISESLNDHLRLRNDYLLAENRILRNQIDGRVPLTNSERKELAAMGAKLGKKALAEIATVATPDTILAWPHKFAASKVAITKPPQSVGRPQIDQEIADLVLRLARENRSWGYDRIQGALSPLGYTISDQTVGNILKRHNIPPAPERPKTTTWGEFIRIHLAVLRATDFCNSVVWSRCGLAISALLCFIHVSRRTLPVAGLRVCLKAYGMLLIPLRASKGLANGQRGVRGVIERRLTRLSGCGGRVRCPRLAAFDTRSHREDPPQSRSKAVRISAVIYRPIRAGPRRYRHQFDALLPINHCEAA